MSKRFVNQIIAEIIADGNTGKVYKRARAKTDSMGRHKVTLYKSELKFYKEVLDVDKTFNEILREVKRVFPDSHSSDAFRITVTMEERYSTRFRRLVSKIITGNELSDSTHFAHQGETTVGIYSLARAQELSQADLLKHTKDLKLEVQYNKALAVRAFKNSVFNVLDDLDWSWKSGETKKALNYFKTLTITGKIAHKTQNKSGSEDFDLGTLKLRKLYKAFELEFAKEVKTSKSNTKLLTTSASPSPVDKLESKLINNFVDKLEGVTKKKIPPKYKNTTSKGTIKKRKKAKKSVKSARLNVSMSEHKKSAINLQALIPELNRKLPDVVAGNMGSPALNYRTGRFASSVRVTDITTTAKGHPSIGFTYMRNPYEVFEHPGGAPHLASRDRDPRKIISQSIRQIAVGLINQRFFTRRT